SILQGKSKMRTIAFVVLAMILLVSCQAEPEATVMPEAKEVATVSEDNQFIVWGQSFLTEEIDLHMEQMFEERHPEIDVVFVDAGWDEALRQNFENAI